MKLNPNFKIVNIVDEQLAVPVGDTARDFKGVVSLTEEAAFLLKQIDGKRQREELLQLILNEYNVKENVARADIDRMLQLFEKIGLIEE